MKRMLKYLSKVEKPLRLYVKDNMWLSQGQLVYSPVKMDDHFRKRI